MTSSKKGTIIPESEAKGRSIFQLKNDACFSSAGTLTWVCATCGYGLIRNAAVGQFRKLVVKCPTCGTLNDII